MSRPFGRLRLTTLMLELMTLGVPQAAQGSGYTLQVLAIRSSWLWAFRFYPSRGQRE
jgi:hypothetical protein